MLKSMQYFAAHPAIAQFSEQFEDENGNCTLSDNDQAAIVAVLAQHAWGLQSGLDDDFWQNAEHAIGDGVETSMEGDADFVMGEDGELDDCEKTSPMWIALSILSQLPDDPSYAYALIAYFVQ